MLITLGGKAGSGKGTVSQLLSKKLGYEIVSIGDMKRQLASEMGLNIQEFNKLGDDPKNAAEFDLKYEDYQKTLPLNSRIILDSRLGFYAQPHAFKILLDVDETVAGKRIFAAQRGTDQFSNENEAIQNVHERNTADADRYQRLYDLQVWNQNNYSLVIDTTERTPEEVTDIILHEFELRKARQVQKHSDLYRFLAEEQGQIVSSYSSGKKWIKVIALLLVLGLIVFLRISAILGTQGTTEQATPQQRSSQSGTQEDAVSSEEIIPQESLLQNEG